MFGHIVGTWAEGAVIAFCRPYVNEAACKTIAYVVHEVFIEPPVDALVNGSAANLGNLSASLRNLDANKLFVCLVGSMGISRGAEHYGFAREQHPYYDGLLGAASSFAIGYVYEKIFAPAESAEVES